MAPINRGFLTAGVLTVIGTFLVAQFYVGNDNGNEGLKVFAAVVAGLILAQVVSRLTEYFTSTETAPVREIAEAARTGPATTVLSGISSGLESSVWAIVAIAGALGVALALGGGNLQFSLYLVALTGMGMLATTGVVVSEDTFGPVADNAAGIAEMSGEFEGEPEKIMVSLDAVGNTTKAVTKGFAIGSAVIAAVALFASFIETIGSELGIEATGSELFRNRLTQINVADPKTFIGLLIGGSVAFRRSERGRRGAGGPSAVPGEAGHHGGHGAARIRPGDRHLHCGFTARAGDPCTPRGAHTGDCGLRHQLFRARRVSRGGHPHGSADGQLPQQCRRRVGQRQKTHRGRPRRRQGF
jgi:K(+)-stimulated pyrophosphate-energized sodium pump